MSITAPIKNSLAAVFALLLLAACASSERAAVRTLSDRLETAQRTPVEDYLLARAYVYLDRPRDALATLGNSPVSDPSLEALRQIVRGLAFENMVDIAAAGSAYAAARAAVPDHPPALVRQAVLSYRLGDLARARDLLAQATDADAGNPEAWYYSLVLARTEAEQAAALANVLAVDGPNGEWLVPALRAWLDR